MMEIGNGDLTIQEQRTHFAVWCFLKSPILLGTDVRPHEPLDDFYSTLSLLQLSNLNTTQLAIIKNTELLTFHQDPTIGKPAAPFTSSPSSTSPPEFYVGQSSKGMHVFIVNTGAAASKSFNFADVPGLGSGSFKVHDMWTGADVGTFAGSFTTTVDTHDTAAFLVTPA